VLFLEVTVADPSEFEARLQVTGEERHGYRDASPGLRRWRGVVGVHGRACHRAAAGRRGSRFQVLFRSGSVIAPMPGDRPQADHEGNRQAEPGHDRAIAAIQGGSMNYSRRVDELQQRVAAIKAAVQAAAAEFREQLRRRDLAGIVITSGQDGRFRTVRASTSSQ
jgi:hypothetical protein